MKLLFISGTFPPDTSATAAVLCKILPCLRERGVEIDALTLKTSFSQENFIKTELASVYRVDAVKYLAHPIRCLRDLCFGIKNKCRHLLKKGENNRLFSESIVQKIYERLTALPLDGYDAVIAVCAYYEAAEALRRYKSNIGLSAKTALYQLDPLGTQALKIHLGEEYIERFERELYAAFDVVFATPSICRYHAETGIYTHKLLPLEQPMGAPVCCEPIEKGKNELRCVYAGAFYGNVRDAGFMLALFSRLRDENIHLYILGSGQEDLIQKYANGPLKGRLHFMGQMPAALCDRWLQSADILVNVGNREAIFVPSKLFHYFTFGKPILNLTEIDDCPTLPYLQRYPLAYTLQKTPSADDAENAARWMRENAGKALPYGQIISLFPDCTPQTVAEKILSGLADPQGGSRA